MMRPRSVRNLGLLALLATFGGARRLLGPGPAPTPGRASQIWLGRAGRIHREESGTGLPPPGQAGRTDDDLRQAHWGHPAMQHRALRAGEPGESGRHEFGERGKKCENREAWNSGMGLGGGFGGGIESRARGGFQPADHRGRQPVGSRRLSDPGQEPPGRDRRVQALYRGDPPRRDGDQGGRRRADRQGRHDGLDRDAQAQSAGVLRDRVSGPAAGRLRGLP